MQLGSNCTKKFCPEQNDFLTLKCVFCKRQFCQKHSRATNSETEQGHLCPNFPKDVYAVLCPLCNQVVHNAQINPDEAVNAHIQKGCPTTSKPVYENSCHFVNCTKREIVAIKCRFCNLTFCIKHRLEQDHKCSPSKMMAKTNLKNREKEKKNELKKVKGKQDCSLM
jgi:predicted nucleic acid binding AN1-type Zn finger protein